MNISESDIRERLCKRLNKFTTSIIERCTMHSYRGSKATFVPVHINLSCAGKVILKHSTANGPNYLMKIRYKGGVRYIDMYEATCVRTLQYYMYAGEAYPYYTTGHYIIPTFPETRVMRYQYDKDGKMKVTYISDEFIHSLLAKVINLGG